MTTIFDKIIFLFQVAAAVGNTSKVLIVDARSYPAAVGNRARGGGVECIEYYPFAEIVFMSLGNIHNIRKSFQALRVLCNQTPSDTLGARWLAALDDTKWLYHTSGLLKAASKVASALHIEARPGTYTNYTSFESPNIWLLESKMKPGFES